MKWGASKRNEYLKGRAAHPSIVEEKKKSFFGGKVVNF